MRQNNNAINNELAKALEVKYIKLTRPLKNEKEPTPTKDLLNDIEWMAAILITKARSKQLHSDLYEYIPAFRIEFLKAAHNNNSEEGNQQLQLLADRLKLKMINFKLIADGEFNNQHQLEKVVTEIPQTTRINNYFNNITETRSIKSEADKEKDKEAIGIALARDDDTLFSDLLKDKNINLSFSFDEGSGNNLLHELLNRDLTQVKNKNMLNALLKHLKTQRIINEPNNDGKRALQAVLQISDPTIRRETANALFESGANLDKKDREGFTPKNPLSALSKQEQSDVKNAYNEILNEAAKGSKKLLAENINTIQANIAINGKEHVLAKINILDSPEANINQKANVKHALALLDSEQLNPTIAPVKIDLEKLESQVKNVNQTLLDAYAQLIQIKRYHEIPKEHDKFDKLHRELNDCIKDLEALQNELYSLSTPSRALCDGYNDQVKVLEGLKNETDSLISGSQGTRRLEYINLKLDVRNTQVSHFNKIVSKINEMHENGEYKANPKAWKILSNYCKTHIADIAKAAGYSREEGLDIDPTEEQLEAYIYKVGQLGPDGKKIETQKKLVSLFKEGLRSNWQTKLSQLVSHLEEADAQLGTLEAKDDKVSKEIAQQTLKEEQPMSQTRPPYFEELEVAFTPGLNKPGKEDELKADNIRQAKEILNKAHEVIGDDKDRVVGITYSANHDQAEKIRETYQQNKEKGEWAKTGTSGANQAAVIAAVEELLETEDYKDLQGNFHILPVSTMAHSGGKGETTDAWLEKDLKSINEFVTNGGHVLGWQNQDTKKERKLLAIGGGVATENKTLSEDQSKLVQLYFQALKESSDKKLEPPMVDFKTGDIITSTKKAPEAAASAPKSLIALATKYSKTLHDNAQIAASLLDEATKNFKEAETELANAKNEDLSLPDRHKALGAAKTALAAASEAEQNAREATAAAEAAYEEFKKLEFPDDANQEDNDKLETIQKNAQLAFNTAKTNKVAIDKLEAQTKSLITEMDALQLPKKEKDFTEDDLQIARHVHNKLLHYKRLINHHRSQIDVAARHKDTKEFNKILNTCKDLKKQLEIYQTYIEHPKLHPHSLFDTVRNFFSSNKLSENGKLVDTYLNRLDEILEVEELKKKFEIDEKIAHFSEESIVVEADKPEDLPQRIKDTIYEKLGCKIKESGGNLQMDTDPESKPKPKATATFEKGAKLNFSHIGDTHTVSVQKMKDKNTYVSEFYFFKAGEVRNQETGQIETQPVQVREPDTSMQGFLGSRIPNDALLKWAIEEVQNFLAYAPDKSQPIRIVGNMPEACVEALVLYCKLKKIPHNATDHYPKVKVEDRHMKHYADRLNKKPRYFADIPKNISKDEVVKNRWATLQKESVTRKAAEKTTPPVKPS